MSYPPASLVTTYGPAGDTTLRAGRLAPQENAVHAAVDTIVDELGPNPSGAYANVQERLDAVTVGQTGYLAPVKAATVLGVTYDMATSFDAGSVLDGETLVAGDRILISQGVAVPLNGVYVVNATGAPTRASDLASGAQFPGKRVAVLKGAVNQGRVFYCSNTDAPTLGTTNIAFVPTEYRPLEVTVSASDGPRGACDLICDGTADEFEVNLAVFFVLVSTVPRGTVRLSAGTYSVASTITTSGFSSVGIVGAGPDATRITRTADVTVLDMSGTAAGARASYGRLAELSLVGSVAPHANPLLRLYYVDNLDMTRVEFRSSDSVGILALEWLDSNVTRCRFSDVGSAGLGPRGGFSGGGVGTTGGRPAVLILGDRAATGSGHATSACQNIRFRDTDFVGCTDGAIQVRGNAAAEDFAGQVACTHSDIVLDGCRFATRDATSGWAPAVTMYRAAGVHVDHTSLVVGSGYAGATAQNVMVFDTCAGVWLGAVEAVVTQTGSVVRTIVRFANSVAVGWDAIQVQVDAGATAPTVAAVEWSGTCTDVERGVVQVRSGTVTSFSGTPTTERRPTGQASITTGAAPRSVVVTHRCVRSPTAAEITWTPEGNPTNDPGHSWVSAIGATTFQINYRNDPGSTLVVSWAVDLVG